MTPAAKSPSKIIMLAPIAVVLIAYVYMFHSPRQNLIRRAKVRVGSLAKKKHNHANHKHGDEPATPASLRKTERKLKAELSQQRGRQQAAIEQLTEMRHELLSQSRPVATVQRVIRLLERHRLQILNSVPEKAALQKSRQSMTALVALLAEDKNGQPLAKTKDIHREVYRLKVAGKFEDVRQALEALAGEHKNVVTLSLEMARLKLKEATEGTQTPIWYLTISV